MPFSGGKRKFRKWVGEMKYKIHFEFPATIGTQNDTVVIAGERECVATTVEKAFDNVECELRAYYEDKGVIIYSNIVLSLVEAKLVKREKAR